MLHRKEIKYFFFLTDNQLWLRDEKLTSNFSFSIYFFYPSEMKFQFLSHINCALQMLSIGTNPQILSFGKELKENKNEPRSGTWGWGDLMDLCVL